VHNTEQVNQGFVNVLGCLLAEDLPHLGFFYHGHDRAGFMDMMETDARRYADDPSLTWERCATPSRLPPPLVSSRHDALARSHATSATCSTFYHERLPWAPHKSLDNVFSGLLVMLFKRHGGTAFLRRWFRSIPLLVQRAPKNKSDAQGARDNFYLAASYAARTDLAPWFTGYLRWTLSRDATSAAVDVFLAAAACDD
jgi:hypothetical protein